MKSKYVSTKTIEKQFDIIRVVVAIALSMILAFILISLVSKEPVEALRQFLLGPLMSKRNFGNVVELAIPLIFAGLSVSIMYQCNQFNMCSEGAIFMGGLGAGWVATRLLLPMGVHTIACIFIGAIFGIIVCFIPAILKVRFGADEVVSSLMLNYVMLYLGTYVLQYILLDPSSGFPSSDIFPDGVKLSLLVGGTRIHSGLIIAILMVIVSYIFIYKSKWGYAIRMTGQNPDFAKYSGIGVGATVLLSQIVGGALAGMGGAVEVLGMYTRFSWVNLPGYGFDGIIIAILAKNNPMFVPLAAFFLAYLRIGADIMSRRTDVAPEVVSIVQALIILLVGAKLFLEKYKHKRIVENSTKKIQEEA